MSDATLDHGQVVTEEILLEVPFLRSLARRLSRRSSDADDLVQEALFRAYRARARFRSGTSMRTWLATILRRVFLTGCRKEQRRRTRTDTDLGEPLGTVSAADRAVESSDACDRALEQVGDHLRRAFVRLPERYRTPFVLFAFEGLTYVEIATHLGVPTGTVMSRIHRARTRLREASMRDTSDDRGRSSARHRGPPASRSPR